MPVSRITETALKAFPLLGCIAWIIYVMVNSPVPEDVGDGIMHFFISQASWEDPHLFLHHWGKPLFILLSSPFAQFGFHGMVIFNTLIFSLTVVLGYAFLQKNQVPVWFQMLLPLVLLKAHDIANTLLGGLTEPLFNLSLMAALVLLQRQKYTWFAITVSAMPFLRSEGQLPVLLAFVLLVYLKQYKIIPLLGTCFLIYALAGIVVYHDFFWYFTKSPYAMNNGIYGKGTWSHYLLSYKNYLGNPGLYIVLLSIPCIALGIRRKKINHPEQWLFAFGVFFGVLFAHSYFWATGQNGSIGLTRVATQGVPVFLVLCISSYVWVGWHKHVLSTILASSLAVGVTFALITTNYYPKPVEPLNQQIIQTANYLKNPKFIGRKVYYHFPLLSFAFGENPFKKNNKLVYYTFNDLENDLKFVLRPGDLIVRDSHFGPVEMGLTKEIITTHPQLHPIKEFLSSKQIDDPKEETEGVVVLEYRPSVKKENTPKENFKQRSITIQPKQEFINLISYLPDSDGGSKKYTLQLLPKSNGFALVYDDKKNKQYKLMDLKKDRLFKGTFFISTNKQIKLYIWNPRQLKGSIVLHKVLIENP
jgi:hypothetical protein